MNPNLKTSWEDANSYLLLNSAYSENEKMRIQKILEHSQVWPAHIWLSTSGSSAPKWVGLSKQAILHSAHAVNQHLQSNKEDRWIKPLPDFHVGGLSIWARAYQSGAEVHDFKKIHPGKWEAKAFQEYVEEQHGTLTSLVPAQVHDLVCLKLKSPASLRAVLVGGGPLLPQLYEEATSLGWPLLPSYGLTECASTVAIAALDSWKIEKFPLLFLLPHIQAQIQHERLSFAGPSLLSIYAYLRNETVQFIDPKVEGWFVSEDRGNIFEKNLEVWGRADSIVKIGGENVDLDCLETLLQTICIRLNFCGEVSLVAIPDPRLGYTIHLAAEDETANGLEIVIREFHQNVLPFERIRQIHYLSQIPRSPLGKVLKRELMSLISNYIGEHKVKD